ncbi:MAG: hypothetical protein MUO31_07580 [Thermodesulfovibrionales bacterium]|nr:hypothetical protein [Thermodesulfovibrionales bacterium]
MPKERSASDTYTKQLPYERFVESYVDDGHASSVGHESEEFEYNICKLDDLVVKNGDTEQYCGIDHDHVISLGLPTDTDLPSIDRSTYLDMALFIRSKYQEHLLTDCVGKESQETLENMLDFVTRLLEIIPISTVDAPETIAKFMKKVCRSSSNRKSHSDFKAISINDIMNRQQTHHPQPRKETSSKTPNWDEVMEVCMPFLSLLSVFRSVEFPSQIRQFQKGAASVPLISSGTPSATESSAVIYKPASDKWLIAECNERQVGTFLFMEAIGHNATYVSEKIIKDVSSPTNPNEVQSKLFPRMSIRKIKDIDYFDVYYPMGRHTQRPGQKAPAGIPNVTVYSMFNNVQLTIKCVKKDSTRHYAIQAYSRVELRFDHGHNATVAESFGHIEENQ